MSEGRQNKTFQPDTVRYDPDTGLAPVIAQDARTGEVLMLGYASPEAVRQTLESGLLTFHSRSRDQLWTKGETSGNTLTVVSLHHDCDSDAILARVAPSGPTCHTGQRSCFAAPPTLPGLGDTLRQRRDDASAEGSYTARLLGDRNLRLKKLGEEAVELATACADEDRERIRQEAGDLIYHALVACMASGVEPEEVLEVLEDRRG